MIDAESPSLLVSTTAHPDLNEDEPRGVSPGMIHAALVILLLFVAWQAPVLVWESRILLRELEARRLSRAVGYEQISPVPTAAQRPRNWFHEDGGSTLLWSGWDPEEGHGWFRFDRGDIRIGQLAGGFGRDTVRAIDYPIVEIGGGPRWQRLQPDTPVVGIRLGEATSAYPLLVLERVEIINDLLWGRPALVLYTPGLPPESSVGVYDPLIDGHRLTLGSTGYLLDGRPLLYDRGTESLWCVRSHELIALAGPLKGARLKRILLPEVRTWADWSASNASGRLVVGADRSRPLPLN